MNREKAIPYIMAIKDYLTAGNPIWDVVEAGEACDMAIEALSVNSKAVVCRECVEYKCPNGMDMICALWNEEVFPDHPCEWGERREDSEA